MTEEQYAYRPLIRTILLVVLYANLAFLLGGSLVLLGALPFIALFQFGSLSASLCFILLAGLGLHNISEEKVEPRRALILAIVLGGFVLLIAGWTLLEALSGSAIAPLESLIGLDRSASVGKVQLEMSPMTALALIMLAVGFLAKDKLARFIAWFVGIAAGLGMAAMIGYFFDVSRLYEFIPGAYKMAILSVLSLLLMAFVLFILYSPGSIDLLFGKRATSVFARRLLVTVLVSPLLSGYVLLLGVRSGWVTEGTGLAFFAVASVAINAIAVFPATFQLNRAEQAREEAELQFLESESRLQAIMDNASAAITVKDLDGKYVLANRAFAQITGLSNARILGRTDRELFPDEVAAIYKEHDGEVLNGGKQVESEEEIFENGDKRAFISMRFPLRDAEDEIYAVCSISTEITQRKEMEDALKTSNKELEQFAYVASHDLQEPLRMVTSYMDLLERKYTDLLDEDGKEFIHFAVDGAARMQRLILDLLAFSRVGTKGKELIPTDSNLALNRALHNLSMRIEETQAEIETEDLPAVMADEDQLVQIFQNLIGNGIKFAGEETPKVQVAVKLKGDEAEFMVEDNGIGFDPQHSDRIFVIFQRLNNRTEYEGTGIGLAICKKIVERHGGHIRAESEPGKGSRFFFTLALVPEDDGRVGVFQPVGEAQIIGGADSH